MKFQCFFSIELIMTLALKPFWHWIRSILKAFSCIGSVCVFTDINLALVTLIGAWKEAGMRSGSRAILLPYMRGLAFSAFVISVCCTRWTQWGGRIQRFGCGQEESIGSDSERGSFARSLPSVQYITMADIKLDELPLASFISALSLSAPIDSPAEKSQQFVCVCVF